MEQVTTESATGIDWDNLAEAVRREIHDRGEAAGLRLLELYQTDLHDCVNLAHNKVCAETERIARVKRAMELH